MSEHRTIEPHCDHHRQFEYDCIDCSDALQEQRSSNSVSIPREMLGRVLNVLGNAASIWPDATGAKDITRLQFELMALERPADETSAGRCLNTNSDGLRCVVSAGDHLLHSNGNVHWVTRPAEFK